MEGYGYPPAGQYPPQQGGPFDGGYGAGPSGMDQQYYDPSQAGPPLGPPSAGGPPGPLSRGNPLKRPYEGGPVGEAPEMKKPAAGPPETVIRVLVPGRRAGKVIGKGGAIVKQLKDMTGARIRMIEGVPGCDERVCVLSCKEDSAAEMIPVQTALAEVFNKIWEDDLAAPGGSTSTFTARLLICNTQVGGVIGKGGVHAREMRETTGINMKIMTPEELPLCGLDNDRAIALVGGLESVHRALQIVAKAIRDSPPRERPGGPPAQLTLLNGGGPGGPPAGGNPYGRTMRP
ncbi:hypothetical protein WJX84_003028 [Apatococcus fuscideae]|uniref:K Homology domain-containing protein n=1 Tax=Apatococcus fuscideae TaxID=2026836 RepID=A0AAW1THE4_9CHLO